MNCDCSRDCKNWRGLRGWFPSEPHLLLSAAVFLLAALLIWQYSRLAPSLEQVLGW